MDNDLIVVEKTSFPWERQKGESGRWYYRFHDFLMLGPNRTMIGAIRKNGRKAGARKYWNEKAIQYDWHNRADAFDQHQAELEEEMRFEVLHSGLSLDWQRVHSLKKIADGEENLVLDTQKELKKDGQALNDSLTKRYVGVKSSYDKTLEAIAQETGGRVKRISYKKELTDYAIELARSQGYDESVAIEIAKMVALDEPK